MAIPQTLITGSIAYLVLGVVLIGIVQAARGVGKLNKDDAGWVFIDVSCFILGFFRFHLTQIFFETQKLYFRTGNVVVIISVFSMWLFWWVEWLLCIRKITRRFCNTHFDSKYQIIWTFKRQIINFNKLGPFPWCHDCVFGDLLIATSQRGSCHLNNLLFSRYFLSQALRMDAPMAPSDRSDLRSLDLPDIRQVKGVIDLQLFDLITILEDTNRFVCSKT